MFYPGGGYNEIGQTGMGCDSRKQGKYSGDPCGRRWCQVLERDTMEKPLEYRFRKLEDHRRYKHCVWMVPSEIRGWWGSERVEYEEIGRG